MIREPYNLNPYNSTIDTSKVNNFSFTFSGDELGSWNIEIAKNNTSPEIVYTSEEFVPEDVGYTHIYDDDIVEGITLPSTIAHSQGDDGLLRRLYSINGYPFNAAVVKLNVNGIENIGSIKGSTANGYLVATNYSLGRAGSNVTITGFDKDGTTIGSQVTDGTYDFLGYLLSVKANSNIQVGQAVQIEGNSFIIGSIADAGDGYSELTIVNGEATISDVTPILTFDSLAEADVTELTVGIEPVQDLNGYDKPWVGGAGKNKLPYPYYESTKTVNGITFTVKADGTIVANGTATSNAIFLFQSGDWTISENYILNGCPSGGSGTTFSLQVQNTGGTTLYDYGSGVTLPSATYHSILFIVRSGYTANNLTAKPMLRKATVSDATWQPYSNICPITGHDEVEVTQTGENLLTAEPRTQPFTVQGVTVTPIDNWHFRLNGTCTTTTWISLGASSYNIILAPSLPNGTYTVSCGSNKIGVYAYADSDTSKTAIGNRLNSITVNSTIGAIRLLMARGQSFSNEDIYVQIVRGTTVPTWTPYQGNTYTTSLGQTVYGGTLDLVTGVLTVDKAMVDLGTLTWIRESIGDGNRFRAPLVGAEVADFPDHNTAICSAYPLIEAGQTAAKKQGFTIASNGNVYIYDGVQQSATGTDFKTAVTGTQLVYELATPQTYQLTPQQIKTLVGTNNVWASSGDIVSITFKYNIN